MLIIVPCMPCQSLACSVCRSAPQDSVDLQICAPASQRSSIVLSDTQCHHIMLPSLLSSSLFDLSPKLADLSQRAVSTQIQQPVTDNELRYISHSPLFIPIRESDNHTATQHAVRTRDLHHCYASTPSSSNSQASRALPGLSACLASHRPLSGMANGLSSLVLLRSTYPTEDASLPVTYCIDELGQALHLETETTEQITPVSSQSKVVPVEQDARHVAELAVVSPPQPLYALLSNPIPCH